MHHSSPEKKKQTGSAELIKVFICKFIVSLESSLLCPSFFLPKACFCSHLTRSVPTISSMTTPLSEAPQVQGKPLTLQMVISSITRAPYYRRFGKALCKGTQFVGSCVSSLGGVLTRQSTKTVWLVGQISCASGFLLFFLTQRPFFYRLSLLGTLFTYGVSVLEHFKTISQTRTNLLTLLLGLDDLTLLVATFLHMATPPHVLKLVSVAVFAWLNLVAYVLNELVPPSSFTASLLPLLNYSEPLLLNWACYAEFLVFFVYWYQVLCCQTLVVYALIFAYLSLRRVELSDLAKKSLHNIVNFSCNLSQKKIIPLSIAAGASSVQKLVNTMVPLEQQSETAVANDVESMKTRATSIIFEGVAILDDLA